MQRLLAEYAKTGNWALIADIKKRKEGM